MYKVKLLSKNADIKWPRYEIQLERNLSFKEATRATYNALGADSNHTNSLSQFKYDRETGIVDTRFNKTPVN